MRNRCKSCSGDLETDTAGKCNGCASLFHLQCISAMNEQCPVCVEISRRKAKPVIKCSICLGEEGEIHACLNCGTGYHFECKLDNNQMCGGCPSFLSFQEVVLDVSNEETKTTLTSNTRHLFEAPLSDSESEMEITDDDYIPKITKRQFHRIQINRQENKEILQNIFSSSDESDDDEGIEDITRLMSMGRLIMEENEYVNVFRLSGKGRNCLHLNDRCTALKKNVSRRRVEIVEKVPREKMKKYLRQNKEYVCSFCAKGFKNQSLFRGTEETKEGA